MDIVAISLRKIIGFVILNLIIMVFLLSLLIAKHKENKLLEKANTELQVRLEETQSKCSNLVEEKYYLYDVVTKVNDGLVDQTKSVINLTKRFSKLKYIPVVIRDTVYRDGDALSPYRSPEDSTKSRGF